MTPQNVYFCSTEKRRTPIFITPDHRKHYISLWFLMIWRRMCERSFLWFDLPKVVLEKAWKFPNSHSYIDFGWKAWALFAHKSQCLFGRETNETRMHPYWSRKHTLHWQATYIRLLVELPSAGSRESALGSSTKLSSLNLHTYEPVIHPQPNLNKGPWRFARSALRYTQTPIHIHTLRALVT